MNSSGKKYGLQLRAPIPAKKPSRPAPPPPGFGNKEDDDDVEDEIARQASKKRSLKDVEQQHKQALEEDPSVFDYDGVYDEMKSKITRPLEQDRVKREPKYIGKLIEKAQTRKQEQEVIYERQLAKERSKEDHLYADKEKFVTAAYKKKTCRASKVA
uniref:Nuclear speckle splicing regulatory protein 1 N-terminal domain-containing protein n=1 Tax=Araucaria cunninghamii TaxID=56994 RepID=A0A0D6R4Q5_ARACU